MVIGAGLTICVWLKSSWGNITVVNMAMHGHVDASDAWCMMNRSSCGPDIFILYGYVSLIIRGPLALVILTNTKTSWGTYFHLMVVTIMMCWRAWADNWEGRCRWSCGPYIFCSYYVVFICVFDHLERHHEGQVFISWRWRCFGGCGLITGWGGGGEY